MKKFALIALASSLAMVGCTTNTQTQAQDSKPMAGEHQGYKDGYHKKGEMRGERPHFYGCEPEAKVVAHYKADSDIIKVNVTAPSLSLDKQDIEMKRAVSASGERFVNETNPKSTYEWHAKGSEGILTVTVNDTEYAYVCQNQKPKHEHGKKPMGDKQSQVMQAQ